MTKTPPRALAVGLLAGLASALLSMGAVTPSAVALFLFLVAAIPVMIAGLGWGSMAGAIAAIISSLAVAIVAGPISGIFIAATTMAPAAWIAHLSTLSRPASELGGPEDAVIWYPLADILFHLALALAVGFVAMGVLAGYDRETLEPFIDPIIANMQANGSDLSLTPEQREEFVSAVTRLVPALNPGIWFLVLFTCHSVATNIVRLMGQSERPDDDRPTALRMPGKGLVLFGLGVAGSFLPGGWGHIAAVLAGTFGAGFIVAGFARMHQKTRSLALRPLILWFVYMAVMLVAPLALIFLVIGLFDTSRSSPLTRRAPPGPPGQT